jgi:uncharacterized SAM-binding protein YcdF (DUF218 family)
MFFYLSKILAFLITPLVWILVLLILALITKTPKWRMRFLVSSLVVFFIFTNSFLTNAALHYWEVPAIPQSKLTEKYEAAIVLGGVSFWDHSLNRIQFSRSSDRVFQALELYHKGYVKKIIISGGSGSIVYPDDKESIEIKAYLLNIGMKDEDILVETMSRNTYENAKYTKALIDSLHLKGPFLLVSSGFHIPRATKCFDKFGIKTTAYSTDRYSGEMRFEPDKILIPNTACIISWDVLLHEMVGNVVYYFSGYY